ncbi:trifunctional histidinol dehydrogenase [Saitoella coloradoensis]
MLIPVLPLVDIEAKETKGLPRESLSHLGHVLITASPANYDSILAYTKSNSRTYNILIDASSELSPDQCVTLLDTGASRLFVTKLEVDSLIDVGVTPSRLVLECDQDEAASGDMDHYIEKTSGIYMRPVHASQLSPELCATLAKKLVNSILPTGGNRDFFVAFEEGPSPKELVAAHMLSITPIVKAEAMTNDPKKEPGLLPIASAILSAAKTDRPDGLFTTLVVNEAGVALGLVYSSEESVKESLRTGTGVYQSRNRGLWYKGATSGSTQELVRVDLDCDGDCLRFTVRQKGKGFCHEETETCFGPLSGLGHLEKTLIARRSSAPTGSYTARLFSDAHLLRQKIMEEAEELCDAEDKDEVAWEAADLIYFALTRVVAMGVSLSDVERNLDAKSKKVSRRIGDAKAKWVEATKHKATAPGVEEAEKEGIAPQPKEAVPAVKPVEKVEEGRIEMKHYVAEQLEEKEKKALLQRPVQKTDQIMGLVTPIVSAIKEKGDAALLEYTEKFDKAKLSSPVLRAPFSEELMKLPQETKEAIDLAFENVKKFHAAQMPTKPLVVETMPGIVCSRFARPINRVGLYIPGGTAVLPSTATMLGVPAMVAGCKTIVMASPPRVDGSLSPEIVYVAHKVGCEAIVLAGGAQAVAALAYGTESVPKVDKIFGPGNQFVTAAKMLVQNDLSALVSIDMPAGPSEVLVIADENSEPVYVASDLLSQAEHGADSQVILIAVDMSESKRKAIEDEVHKQASGLPRVDIIRKSIAHSYIYSVKDMDAAMAFSNAYAPEHLILHVDNASSLVEKVESAGSIFVGQYSPESCGDYASGTNHSLPTYGFANTYSGVNTGSYLKHITSQELTRDGLMGIGRAVMRLADVEGLHAHRDAVRLRLEKLEN